MTLQVNAKLNVTAVYDRVKLTRCRAGSEGPRHDRPGWRENDLQTWDDIPGPLPLNELGELPRTCGAFSRAAILPIKKYILQEVCCCEVMVSSSKCIHYFPTCIFPSSEVFEWQGGACLAGAHRASLCLVANLYAPKYIHL